MIYLLSGNKKTDGVTLVRVDSFRSKIINIKKTTAITLDLNGNITGEIFEDIATYRNYEHCF